DRLPTSVSGKLDRRRLPVLEVHAPEVNGDYRAPRDAREARVAEAVGKALGLHEPVSVDHDFFTDLGGDSLRAAMVVSLLREVPELAALTVRDLYDARTVAGLAARAAGKDEGRRRGGLGGATAPTKLLTKDEKERQSGSSFVLRPS